VFLAIFVVFFLAVLVGGALLARRNLRLDRGDRRGATRTAAFVLGAWAVTWFLGAHHVPNFAEFPLFMEFLVWGGGFFCFTWLLYIALEPYVRRRWPATLVSWSRLLAGGFRDPLVGRDLLAGCLSGSFLAALQRLLWFVPSWLGHPPPQPLLGPDWQFLGARMTIAATSSSLAGAPVFWLALLFVLFLLRTLLRKQWAAAVVFALLLSIFVAAGSQFEPVTSMGALTFGCVAVFLLTRFGLLTVVTNFIFWSVLETFPLTTQWSAWYAGISLTGILLMAVMAFYGFYTSLGGRPLFGGAALED
jgi:hypothetical protein